MWEARSARGICCSVLDPGLRGPGSSPGSPSLRADVSYFLASLGKGTFSERSKEVGDVCMQAKARLAISLCSRKNRLYSNSDSRHLGVQMGTSRFNAGR